MELSVECLPCLVNQAVRLVKIHLDNEKAQRILVKKIMLEIGASDDTASTPYIAHKMQQVLKDVLQNPDPYRDVKLYYNSEMLKLEKEFLAVIRSAEDQLGTALKLAAAGNIIDFGPGHDLSRAEVLKVLNQTLEKEFNREVFTSLY